VGVALKTGAQVPPETIERWRQSQIAVVHFDAANRLENVTAKAPSLA
jgi:hypothetical protein